MFVCRFGIYPLTAYALEPGPVRLTTYQPQSPTGSMDQSVPSDRSSAGPVDVEVRRIVNMMCNIKPRDDAQNDFMVSIRIVYYICTLFHDLFLFFFFLFVTFYNSLHRFFVYGVHPTSMSRCNHRSY